MLNKGVKQSSGVSVEEFDAHRRRYRRDVSGGFEFSAFLVDAEAHDRIAILVGRQQEMPLGIEGKIPWCSSSGRNMADPTEQPAGAVYPVDDDAVVTTVRGIHEAPAR